MDKQQLVEKYKVMFNEGILDTLLGGAGKLLGPAIGAGAGLYGLDQILDMGKYIVDKSAQGGKPEPDYGSFRINAMTGSHTTRMQRGSTPPKFDAGGLRIGGGEPIYSDEPSNEGQRKEAYIKSMYGDKKLQGMSISDRTAVLGREQAMAANINKAYMKDAKAKALDNDAVKEAQKKYDEAKAKEGSRGTTTITGTDGKPITVPGNASGNVKDAEEKLRTARANALKGNKDYQRYAGAYASTHQENSPIQPVENRGGEATRKYGEMLRSPGGVPGAMARQRADDTWKKWQDEDSRKNTGWGFGEREAFEKSERERVSKDTQSMEKEMRGLSPEKFNKQYPSVFDTDPAKAQGSLLGIQARDANAEYDAAVRRRAAAEGEAQKFKDPNTLGPLSPEKPDSQFNTADEKPSEEVANAAKERTKAENEKMKQGLETLRQMQQYGANTAKENEIREQERIENERRTKQKNEKIKKDAASRPPAERKLGNMGRPRAVFDEQKKEENNMTLKEYYNNRLKKLMEQEGPPIDGIPRSFPKRQWNPLERASTRDSGTALDFFTPPPEATVAPQERFPDTIRKEEEIAAKKFKTSIGLFPTSSAEDGEAAKAKAKAEDADRRKKDDAAGLYDVYKNLGRERKARPDPTDAFKPLDYYMPK